MKRIHRIGLGPVVQIAANTYGSPTSPDKWYDIELSDVDGRIVAKCLNLQGAVSDGKDEDEAMNNIIEAIRGIEGT